MIAFYLTFIEDHNNDSKFEMIYNTYRDKMFNAAYGILKDYHYAEDALQECFINIAKMIDTIRIDDVIVLKAYLMKAVKNSALDVLKKKRRADLVLSIENIDDFSTDDSVEKQLEDREKEDEIFLKILNMPIIYRDVMELSLLQGFSIKEIAITLNLNQRTVWNRYERGKQYLRKILAEEGVNDNG